MAHPDDEFLFGFPVIHRAKKIIACVDDKTHPTRTWCRRRDEAFKEICAMVGAEAQVLRFDSGFRGLEHEKMKDFVGQVFHAVKDAETLFTHNAWGEYGHWDHIILHGIARQAGKPVLTTDISLHADWYHVQPVTQGLKVDHCRNDMRFHEQCMEIYHSKGAMGWTMPPVQECNLIEVLR